MGISKHIYRIRLQTGAQHQSCKDTTSLDVAYFLDVAITSVDLSQTYLALVRGMTWRTRLTNLLLKWIIRSTQNLNRYDMQFARLDNQCSHSHWRLGGKAIPKLFVQNL